MRWVVGVGFLACGCPGDPGSQSGESDTGTVQDWQTVLEVDDAVGSFLSIWGPSADDLYAVGGQTLGDESTRGFVYRYDGQSWAASGLPPGTPGLNWVYGVEQTRVLVGEGGTVIRRDGDDDANAWTTERCETDLPLWGVWGASADALWSVGGDGVAGDPVLCRFDGAAWSLESLPALSFETHALFKVWGTAADNVFAVGDAGLILHFDGRQWSEQPSGTQSDLIALWGRGPDDILAVGGRSNGVLARYDGAIWTTQSLPDTLGLNGVWMDPQGEAVVVGSFGTAAVVAQGSFAPTVETTQTSLVLHAVFSPAPGRYLAVGGSLDSPPPYEGVIAQRK